MRQCQIDAYLQVSSLANALHQGRPSIVYDGHRSGWRLRFKRSRCHRRRRRWSGTSRGRWRRRRWWLKWAKYNIRTSRLRNHNRERQETYWSRNRCCWGSWLLRLLHRRWSQRRWVYLWWGRHRQWRQGPVGRRWRWVPLFTILMQLKGETIQI